MEENPIGPRFQEVAEVLFSERYGYKKLSQSLGREDMPGALRNRIWNVFYVHVFRNPGFSPIAAAPPAVQRFVLRLCNEFFEADLESFLSVAGIGIGSEIKTRFFGFKWYEVYDFIEFFAAHYGHGVGAVRDEVINDLNHVLETKRAPYRIVGNTVVPLTSEEEIKEIEQALELPQKFKPAAEHFEKALNLFSDRKKPDYKNSIKESISAVESLVQILLGKKGTLADLIKKLPIHPAMKEAFHRLYGWTSDEGGIRHGKFDEELSAGESEARFMLITTSAFINYVIAGLDASAKT